MYDRKLTGEEVKAELQCAIEWFSKHGKNTNSAIISICQHAKAEIERLEKSVLPCKIGDTAWVIRNYSGKMKAVQGKISEMYFIDGMKLCIIVKNIAGGEWGKAVFPTYEAAQKAIDGRAKK